MTENKFRCTNISENGNTGLFWLGKDNLSVYDVLRLLNELYDENKKLLGENEQLKQVSKELSEDNKRLQRCVNDIYTIARLEGLE